MPDVAVSEAVALYFYEQCCGKYTGHMAAIPYNPKLHSLMKAHSIHESRHAFARFLRQVADLLEKGEPF